MKSAKRVAIGIALEKTLQRDAKGRFLPRSRTGRIPRKRRARKQRTRLVGRRRVSKKEPFGEERMETSTLATARKVVQAARIIGAPIPGATAALDIAALFGII